jgi:hypothetical protein
MSWIKYRGIKSDGIRESLDRSELEQDSEVLNIQTIQVETYDVAMYRWPVFGGMEESEDEQKAIDSGANYETFIDTRKTETVIS